MMFVIMMLDIVVVVIVPEGIACCIAVVVGSGSGSDSTELGPHGFEVVVPNLSGYHTLVGAILIFGCDVFSLAGGPGVGGASTKFVNGWLFLVNAVPQTYRSVSGHDIGVVQ